MARRVALARWGVERLNEAARHSVISTYRHLRFDHPRRGLAVAGLAALIALWWWANWFVRPSSPSERINLIQAAAQIAGGAVLLVGVYLTWQTLQTNREGQITERWTHAVAQLGADRLATRLGGIYALERIAKDSPRDRRQMVEVLSAYVRENAQVGPDWPAWRMMRAEEASTVRPEADALDRLRAPADIQAILTVLGRRTHSEAAGDPPVDLRDTDLRHANLSELHFEGAILDGANLAHVNLMDAVLDRASFSHANLRSALMSDASLQEAWLGGAAMEWASLSRANLSYANLSSTHLEHARFLETNLHWANLAHARLDNAWLSQADLEGAEFAHAVLDGTDLRGAILRRADLRGADLRQAAGLMREQLAEARTDDTTLRPAHLAAVDGPATTQPE